MISLLWVIESFPDWKAWLRLSVKVLSISCQKKGKILLKSRQCLVFFQIGNLLVLQGIHPWLYDLRMLICLPQLAEKYFLG